MKEVTFFSQTVFCKHSACFFTLSSWFRLCIELKFHMLVVKCISWIKGSEHVHRIRRAVWRWRWRNHSINQLFIIGDTHSDIIYVNTKGKFKWYVLFVPSLNSTPYIIKIWFDRNKQDPETIITGNDNRSSEFRKAADIDMNNGIAHKLCRIHALNDMREYREG